jgi:hypothetical protein
MPSQGEQFAAIDSRGDGRLMLFIRLSVLVKSVSQPVNLAVSN